MKSKITNNIHVLAVELFKALPTSKRWVIIISFEVQAFCGVKRPSVPQIQMLLPEDDVDWLQPWGYVGLGDLGRVGLQQVRLGGLDVRDRRGQTLPQTQQVVNTVGGKLPVLKAGAVRRKGEQRVPAISWATRGAMSLVWSISCFAARLTHNL